MDSKAFISAIYSFIKIKKPKQEAQTIGVILQGEADPLGRPGETAVNLVDLHRRLCLLPLPLLVLLHILIWCQTEAMCNRVNYQAGAEMITQNALYFHTSLKSYRWWTCSIFLSFLSFLQYISDLMISLDSVLRVNKYSKE